MNLRHLVVYVQTATFFVLAVLLWREGQWRLAAAQLLLGFVTALVYLGNMQ